MCARLAADATRRYRQAVTTDRRRFLKRAALVAASTAGAQRVDPQVAAPRSLDAVLLAAVGEAVLPESLGPDGRAQAVAAFARWLAGYAPVTEQMHGYGDAEITYTPSDPAPGWDAQLAGLDLLARRKHRRAFARLGVPLRRAVLATQIGRGGGARLPSDPLAATHVAVALMAHWAASSTATDLAYQARIAKGECRVLADTVHEPLPIRGAVRS